MIMKLYLLRPIDPESGPWTPWYDKNFGFVVRAESEDVARTMAQNHRGDETGESWRNDVEIPAWTDPTLSTCVELTAEGEPEIVMIDNMAA